MKERIIVFGLLAAMAMAPMAFAGNIYGSITEAGKPVAKGVKIDIDCGSKNYSTETDANGGYKIFVAETGKCELKVSYQGQTASFEVSSYENSAQFDLILEKKDGKYTLKRK